MVSYDNTILMGLGIIPDSDSFGTRLLKLEEETGLEVMGIAYDRLEEIIQKNKARTVFGEVPYLQLKAIYNSLFENQQNGGFGFEHSHDAENDTFAKALSRRKLAPRHAASILLSHREECAIPMRPKIARNIVYIECSDFEGAMNFDPFVGCELDDTHYINKYQIHPKSIDAKIYLYALNPQEETSLIHQFVVDALINDKRFALAGCLAESGLQIDPGNMQIRTYLARISLESGRFKEAEQYCTSVLNKDPNHPLALNVMAQVHKHKKDYAAMKNYLERLLDLNQKDTYANRSLAELHEVEGDIGLAINHLMRAMIKDPNDPVISRKLAKALETQGNYHDAKRHYERSIKNKHAWAEPRIDLAKLHFKTGDYNQAIEQFHVAGMLEQGRYNELTRQWIKRAKWSERVLRFVQRVIKVDNIE
ncbi:hypothetical protein COT47_08590 [Candidatus Woesearchaeota archaeon CG08_land_8_20_14_0_20_43_7]|nr:MAG: hypothetical protein COT47_08590 [Candidatus Woesearchaeota archaeon CG08_land_8_20_14_0_20_43_7]